MIAEAWPGLTQAGPELIFRYDVVVNVDSQVEFAGYCSILNYYVSLYDAPVKVSAMLNLAGSTKLHT